MVEIEKVQIVLNRNVVHLQRGDADKRQHVQMSASPSGAFLLGGIVLALVVGFGAFLMGTSIWISILIYAVTGAFSTVGLALYFVSTAEPGDRKTPETVPLRVR